MKGYENDALKGVKIPNFQGRIKKAGSGAMAKKMKKGAYEFIDEMIFGEKHKGKKLKLRF